MLSSADVSNKMFFTLSSLWTMAEKHLSRNTAEPGPDSSSQARGLISEKLVSENTMNTKRPKPVLSPPEVSWHLYILGHIFIQARQLAFHYAESQLSLVGDQVTKRHNSPMTG